MQRLSEKILRSINSYFIVFVLILFSIYLYTAVDQGTIFVSELEAYGLNFLMSIFLVGFLVYNFGILPFVKNINVWVAYCISFFMFLTINSLAVELTIDSTFSILFIVNNFLISFASVAFGPILIFPGIGIVLVIYTMTITGSTTPTIFGPLGDGLGVAIRITVTIFLFYIVRRHYLIEGVNNRNYIERYFVNNEVVKLLTDSIGDAVMIVDNAGYVKSINPKALDVLNREIEGSLGVKYSKLLNLKTIYGTEIDESDNPVYRALNSIESVVQEVVIDQIDEDKTYIDLNVSTISDPSNGDIYGAVIIFRDISEKKLEEEARNDFISTASHEMRTPVAAIEGFLALAMSSDVGHIDEKNKEFLEKAHDNTKHLGRLFRDLLISSEAEDGRLINHPKNVDLVKLIDDKVLEKARLAAKSKGLDISLKISSDKGGSSDPKYYSHVDPDRMNELFSNLVENAIKYSDDGEIEVGITGDEKTVQVYIKDTGIGIPSKHARHLFQKFYRVDSSSTRSTGGTGLGLFICKKVVDLYGGSIWVESKKDVGSTFYVNLPRVSSQDIKAS